MKFVAISDSHGQHADLVLPSADCIVHAGDVSKRGTPNQIKDFLLWFGKLDYQYKIFIAGNHDFFFERSAEAEIKELIPENVIYLNDSGCQIEGINIWGSPIQPWFFDWAFNRSRGEAIRQHWDLIPEGTDILLTHGPPKHILDKTEKGEEHVGCEELAHVVKHIQPAYHIFGHIHEAYGQLEEDFTTYINASVLNLKYKLVNDPVVFEYSK